MEPVEAGDQAKPPRAVVLTALPVEYHAARQHLADLVEHTHPDGTIYEVGRFSGTDQIWDVVLAEMGKGIPRAAIETARAIQHFSPDVVMFVGIAGGLKDVRLGDVVAATKVYAYEVGRDERVFMTRPELAMASHRMEQRARAEAKHGTWTKRLVGTQAGDPVAIVAPIAAGSSVVASSQSRSAQLLRQSYSDAVAVEMEGYGVLEGARSHPNIDALVVRGISDMLDDKQKTDAEGKQELAARNAAAFAFEILARLVVKSPPHKTESQQSPERTSSETAQRMSTPRFALLTLSLIFVLAAIYESLASRYELPSVRHLDPLMLTVLSVGTFVNFWALSSATKNTDQHTKAALMAATHQHIASTRLKYLLKERLLAHCPPELWTPNAVHALAKTVQSEFRSPRLGNLLINEILRQISLEIEENYRGEQQWAYVNRINKLTHQLHPEADGRCSIGTVDPISAYRLSASQAVAAMLPKARLLIAVFLLVGLAIILPSRITTSLSWIAITFYVIRGIVSSISGLRSLRYWAAWRTSRSKARNWRFSLFSPRKLSPIFDFFSYVTISHNLLHQMFYDVYWAPIWESPHLHTGALAFANMHFFRYFDASPIKSELYVLHQAIEQTGSHEKQLRLSALADYAGLCQELWIKTGDSRYRELEQRALAGQLPDLVDGLNTLAEFNPFQVDVANHAEAENKLPDDQSIQPGHLRALEKRFRKLQRTYVLWKAGLAEMLKDERLEYVAICRELAALTSDKKYEQLFQEALEASSDIELNSASD